ncbi:MAG: [FeFe] hydrogenase H-cluster radical SAM maturase HydE [Ignavibacteria bacterium]|nr:[FeFe] hydrogenase H-cluster radical SAM maturase HydE [Ignavibacteria bacterium]
MKLEEILNKENYSRDEIIYLLNLKNPEEMQKLYKHADEVRKRYCGDEVHMRGIIEISNYCEQNCLYCGLREDNISLERFRMSVEEIIETANQITKLGIFTIVLQSGEDSEFDADFISHIIFSIKQKSNAAITLSLGERGFDEYRAWKIAGADRYLLKHETSNKKLYSLYHSKQKLIDRINHIKFLKRIGYQVGSGNMIGLPMQTIEDIADDILLCKELDLDMAAFGPFIPSPNTPYHSKNAGSPELTLKVTAVLRLVLKNVHIPATTALDTLDQLGREKGLNVGANVIMPDLTPHPYRDNYQIYPGKRGVADDPVESALKLQRRVEALGRKISFSRGDSMKIVLPAL